MFPAHMRLDEQKIVRRLILRALDKGWVVSVFDGEEWPVKKSNDFEKITAEIAATDETQLRFRNADGETRGWMLLVHGNGDEVIADYTDNNFMEELTKGIDA